MFHALLERQAVQALLDTHAVHALIETHAVQALLRKRAAHQAYRRTVDDYLTILFRGFPEHLLAPFRQRPCYGAAVRQGQAAGTDARVCAVQAAVLLIRKIIGGLSLEERQDLLRAFLENDASNPAYKGFKYMFRVVEHLDVPPALASYLGTEVAGQLRGLSQTDIFGAWIETQIGGVMGRLRTRCLEEAELNRELWQ